MSVYAPDYYCFFRCSADRCQHTCCAGWEIDIDQDSLFRFEHMQGKFGDELRDSISTDGNPHFRLREDGRCPMLREDGLCRMIVECGQDSLCQICADHPRFRNFWSGRVEIGLGMVCEEAARLILTRPYPMNLVLLEGNGKELLPQCERGLFRLRQKLLRDIRESGPRARLKEYLIYRHIADAVYDGRLIQRIAFVNREYNRMIRQWTDGKISTLCEICRRFSDEVEYDSDELERRISSCGKK